MRVLTTAETGLIGWTLSTNLLAGGVRAVVPSRALERATGLLDSVQVERWDACTAEGWAHMADKVDAIVNLAGANLAGPERTGKGDEMGFRIWLSLPLLFTYRSWKAQRILETQGG